MRIRLTIAGLLLLALLATACSSSEGQTDSTSAAPDDEPTTAPTAVPAATATAEPATPEPATPEPTAAAEPTPTADEAASSDAGCGAGAVAGTTSQVFEFEGRERTFEQLLPTSYNDTSPLPVVLNWHGLGSNGPEQLNFSDYARLAEAEGFIVIAPTGLPAPGDARNSWELDPDSDPTRDDLAFANALLDLVIDTLCVDPARVYSTGMSNGGYFTSILICNMADRIAAAASVAALTHPDDCEPTRTVPYIGFHGTDDAVVPYAGGGESVLVPEEIVDLFLLDIGAEFAEFAVGAGCSPEPFVKEVSENVTLFDYVDCPANVSMNFYEIAGGGHTWPGSTVSLTISEAVGLGVTTTEISASETSWGFFKQYSLDS